MREAPWKTRGGAKGLLRRSSRRSHWTASGPLSGGGGEAAEAPLLVLTMQLLLRDCLYDLNNDAPHWRSSVSVGGGGTRGLSVETSSMRDVTLQIETVPMRICYSRLHAALAIFILDHLALHST